MHVLFVTVACLAAGALLAVARYKLKSRINYTLAWIVASILFFLIGWYLK